MQKSACVIMEHTGKFLVVSRKNDPTDFGLPGGKLDFGETFAECAIRECLEETGMMVTLTDDAPFIANDGNYEVATFLVKDLVGAKPIDPKETGVVSWKDADTLLKGYFGYYNARALQHFGFLKKFEMFYTGMLMPSDIVYAKSASEAALKFVRESKGRVYINKVEQI